MRGERVLHLPLTLTQDLQHWEYQNLLQVVELIYPQVPHILLVLYRLQRHMVALIHVFGIVAELHLYASTRMVVVKPMEHLHLHLQTVI